MNKLLSELVPGGICLAFSGGVDSALLLRLCGGLPGGPVHAVTMHTPFHALKEPEEAARLAAEYGAVHHIMHIGQLDPALELNPTDRCYICKKWIFTAIWDYARQNSVTTVLDGTNADDLLEYRPGLRALSELGVRSPLAELGITKRDVRDMAAGLGISVAQKPSSPCLATRLPYGAAIRVGTLRCVEVLEEKIRGLGVSVVRVRVYGDTLRIEVLPEHFKVMLTHRDEIVEAAHDCGFLYVTLDLEGFRSGSMDLPLTGSRMGPFTD